MNPVNVRELLTAAVDGELTPAERKAAERLLRESAAARALFAQLKADADRLRKLPRVLAPADLADNILATIRDRAMSPTPLPPARPHRRFNWSSLPVWANVLTAATVLLMISAGSYLYFTASHHYYAEQNQKVARKDPSAGETSARLPRPTRDTEAVAPAPKAERRDSGPETIAIRPRDVGPEIGPPPREAPADILTERPTDMPEIESFQLDKIRVSHFFALHDLPGDEAARKKLTDEMRKDELIRLDLFCRSSPRALDMVLAALKARGITALTDAYAVEQLKKKAPPEVMIFTEALSPDEVTQVLTAVGAEDKKRAGDEAMEFDALVAAPFLPADLTKLSRLLGVPNLEPKPAKGKAGIDIRKPLPEGTASQLASSLAKLGSGAPKAERVAVVVSYAPANPTPTTSREIKQFLDRRGDRKADAKPLMLVLRTVK